MEDLFVPYEQAVTLKEIGFDENCFRYYSITEHTYPIDKWGVCTTIKTGSCLDVDTFKYLETLYGNKFSYIKAPCFQQAFDWFRDKHKLYGDITPCYELNENNNPCGNAWQIYTFDLSKLEDGKCDEEVYADYKISRLECLKKLIFILKNKQ